ncbi:DNA repair protein RecO [Sedimenticola selenatireducens]|uniref:DNA repair protein RecO n=1 Tax=Sedimenticola selenatireducens TaxID=191960 RepID=UPI0004B89F4B
MNTAGTSTLSAAFLLHRRDYSNSSLLVECFTEQQGRFPAVAKGVKGRGKSASGLLQPFVPLQINWSGRGEVKNLTHYEPDGRMFRLDGKALFCGFYINELLIRLLQRNDPHERLFQNYRMLLSQLDASGINEASLRYFELEMLVELGYGIELTVDLADGRPVEAAKWYRFVQESGVTECPADIEHAISGQTLLSLELRSLNDPRQLKEARNLLRTVLGFYLGDKPLKSRELFRHAL